MSTLRFELSVEMDDGTKWEVVADQRDVARWEVQPFGWPAGQIKEQVSMAFFRFLAWSASTRQQFTTDTWEKFDGLCVEAMPLPDPEDDDDASDPGQSAPSGSRT